jgi:hypothetical protein
MGSGREEESGQQVSGSLEGCPGPRHCQWHRHLHWLLLGVLRLRLRLRQGFPVPWNQNSRKKAFQVEVAGLETYSYSCPNKVLLVKIDFMANTLTVE